MKAAAIRTVGKAAGQRVVGQQPGRMQAAAAAAITGVVAAALTYRALRAGG